MDPDDLPRKPPGIVIGDNLDSISVAELGRRVETLEQEIARIRAEIARKQASRNAADAFFRT